MTKQILLLEPNYQNKYPPIGLMKIATYHRRRGDSVKFFKGDLEEFVASRLREKCVTKMQGIDPSIDWCEHSSAIQKYIKRKTKENLELIPLVNSRFEILLNHAISDYSDYFKKRLYRQSPEFDRVFVATLFTFYWDITIRTIEFAKDLVKDSREVLVGGVMASLLPKEIEVATGIQPISGLLDRPGMLDEGDSTIIDDLPLDYSILDEVEYQYPTQSAYFTFMTKGCTRTCAFCSVPKIEPTYKPYIPTLEKFAEIKRVYGEQQNLLLMDNNVLASPRFTDIIQEIKDMGFVRGATFKEPNQLDISIRNLQAGINDGAYLNRSFRLLHSLFRLIKGDSAQSYYDVLERHRLMHLETATKEALIGVYPLIREIYEKYRPKGKKNRYVDFNQGIDCRYINDDLMRLISQISIRPLRIAFDYIGLKEQYMASVRLAAKYGIRELSNYILYNFTDKPQDLYHRLKINVELARELGIEIYSFPMKYIPLYGEEAKHRNHVGPHWNRKFIRAIQSVLNVTKGIVASGDDFFQKAFGVDLEQFEELLYMPENYIINRKIFEDSGATGEWRKLFNSLTQAELDLAKPIIHRNDFRLADENAESESVRKLLYHYIGPKLVKGELEPQARTTERRIRRLIKEDKFVDLTLTYDFDDRGERAL